MIFNILACSSLILSPEAFSLDQKIEPYRSIECLLHDNYQLTDKERDKLFREAEFAAIKAQKSLEKAKACFSKIVDLDVREACTSAVTGVIFSFATSGSKEKAVVVLLTIIGNHTANAGSQFWKGYDHLQDAKRYSAHCDACQEALWRD